MTMANNPCLSSAFVFVILALLKLSGVVVCNFGPCQPIPASDKDLIQFALNLEFLEAEFFLNGARGGGLDAIDPSLASGGPPPIAPQMANLDPQVHRIIEEFGYQEVGHLRAIINRTGGGFARPQLNLNKQVFANIFDQALGFRLTPSFDPYANAINFLLTSNLFPYLGLGGYVGAIPLLSTTPSRSLVASLLGVEAGQDAVIRALLYQRANEMVPPYNMTVADVVDRTSALFSRLGNCGLKDEGLVVPRSLGAENRTESNVLAADDRSLSYSRTPQEILRIVYGSGDERSPGGFFPNGANGRIARSFVGDN